MIGTTLSFLSVIRQSTFNTFSSSSFEVLDISVNLSYISFKCIRWVFILLYLLRPPISWHSFSSLLLDNAVFSCPLSYYSIPFFFVPVLFRLLIHFLSDKRSGLDNWKITVTQFTRSIVRHSEIFHSISISCNRYFSSLKIFFLSRSSSIAPSRDSDLRNWSAFHHLHLDPSQDDVPDSLAFDPHLSTQITRVTYHEWILCKVLINNVKNTV